MKQQGKEWAAKHKGRGKGHRGQQQGGETTSAATSTHEKDERTLEGQTMSEKDHRI